jgi:glutamate-1-semialdehyde aminotransferase
MTHTIDPATLRRDLSHKVKTGNGMAYLDGTVSAPDPLVAELFADVREALDKYEALSATARELQAKLRHALDDRADHKESPEAVFTADSERGLVFTDAEGVRLQNAVKAIEKEIASLGTRSKQAFLDYLVLAIIRQAEAKDEALARALAADEAANAAAKALLDALADRERYWTAAGQPYPGVADPQAPHARTTRVMLQHQRHNDLKHAIERALPFPLKAGK